MSGRMNGPQRRKIVESFLREDNPDAMFLDGLDGAIVGTVTRLSKPTLVAYDMHRIIAILMRRGFTYEEAIEWFAFNIEGSWVGENTPVLLTRVKDLEGIV